jgi:hypothetical protein
MAIPNPLKTSTRPQRKNYFPQHPQKPMDPSMKKFSDLEIFIQKQKSSMARIVSFHWKKKFNRLKNLCSKLQLFLESHNMDKKFLAIYGVELGIIPPHTVDDRLPSVNYPPHPDDDPPDPVDDLLHPVTHPSHTDDNPPNPVDAPPHPVVVPPHSIDYPPHAVVDPYLSVNYPPHPAEVSHDQSFYFPGQLTPLPIKVTPGLLEAVQALSPAPRQPVDDTFDDFSCVDQPECFDKFYPENPSYSNDDPSVDLYQLESDILFFLDEPYDNGFNDPQFMAHVIKYCLDENYPIPTWLELSVSNYKTRKK